MEAPVLVGFLVIVAVWSFYLLPSVLGDRRRNTPISSTSDFDKWANVMSEVQHRPFSASRSAQKNQVLVRRRRVLLLLGGLAVATLAAAWITRDSVWLMAQILSDMLLFGYVVLLLQIKGARDVRVAQDVAPVRREARAETRVRLIS